MNALKRVKLEDLAFKFIVVKKSLSKNMARSLILEIKMIALEMNIRWGGPMFSTNSN